MSAARKLVAVAVTMAILLGLNQIFEYGFGDFQINPYYARIVNLIGINITLAVSLNLINGLAGQFSIGHAGFMAVGGYTATYLTVYHGDQIAGLLGGTLADGVGASVVMIASLTAGALAAAVAGLVVGIPVAPSQGRLPRDRDARVRRDHPRPHPQHSGRRRRDRIHRRDPDHELLLDLLDGHHDDRHRAQHRRVDVRAGARGRPRRTRSPPRRWASIRRATRCSPSSISAALAGVAGGLSGQLFANPLNPQNLNFVKSIEVIVMIVLGGIGSITGAVFGATTLTILPEALRTFDQQFPGLRMVIYALLLILLMIFRPQGLFGRRELGWSWLRPPSPPAGHRRTR